jgi:hypothetical protein
MSIVRLVVRALTAIVVIQASMSLPLAAPRAQDGVSPHLTILSANIAEESFADAKPILERVATLTITVAARPACSPEGPPLSYAFLVDRDRSTRTGALTRAFSEIGIDVILEIRCDPTTGRLSSTLGDVAVQPAEESPQAHTITLTTRVRSLPSVDFYWVAMARQGRRFDRLPATGRSGAWRAANLWIG